MAWKGHCDVAPQSPLMKNLWPQLLGERWADRLRPPASSGTDQLLRVPCPRPCPFLGGPQSVSGQCKNIKSWTPWPKTKAHLAPEFPAESGETVVGLASKVRFSS